MRIPKELTPLAYDFSKKVLESELTHQEGQEQLAGNNRMNKNSAANYIRNFQHMLKGERFTRTINAYSMEYFFENIYKDFGSAKLSKALMALKLHIEYYERKRKVKMRVMRAIYDKYSAVSIDSPDEQEQNEIVEEFKQQRKSKQEIVNELKNLKSSDSEVITINSKSFKRDNKTIAQIKYLRGFKCQICSKVIKKKDGSLYVEAAHIEPKCLKGRETLDNILLLCPNHHKEFDLGDRKIIEHDKNKIRFKLNGKNSKEHNISLEIK